MSKLNNEDAREAFEKWWRNRGLGVGTGKKAAWHAYQEGRKAMLAERDALRRQLEWTAQYANESVTAGSRDLDDWIGDMQHIEISARAALGQGQEET